MRFRRSIDENIESIRHAIRDAASQGAGAILFPECATTGYHRDFRALKLNAREVHDALNAVSGFAKTARCNVLVGSPTFHRGHWFNSLAVFDRRGREVFRYSKIHLTQSDAHFFTPGNSLAYFKLDWTPSTAIICHERRYPELVRLPVMMGAQIVFHPNAGLDSLAVSKTKRKGRDGIVARAFENQIYYVFANSVGPQGNGLWSAGDSKIVGPDCGVLAQANNRDEAVIVATLNLKKAGRKYAIEALEQPTFLKSAWKQMIDRCRRQI